MYMYEPMTVPGLNIICTCGLAEQVVVVVSSSKFYF